MSHLNTSEDATSKDGRRNRWLIAAGLVLIAAMIVGMICVAAAETHWFGLRQPEPVPAYEPKSTLALDYPVIREAPRARVSTPPVPPMEDDDYLVRVLQDVVNAQPSLERKMNHFFLRYCATTAATEPPRHEEYGQYTRVAQTLYERLRAEMLASDDTNETLVKFPASFAGAVEKYCTGR